MRADEAPAASPLPTPRRGEWALARSALFILTAILLAYANALLWGDFQFDDFNVIVGNPQVHSWQAWWNDLGRGIRPLLKASYTLDWTRGGGSVSPFHLTNLAIHGVNALLVLLLAMRYAVTQPQLRHEANRIALSAALLFALHPIATEAVSYVCGRSSALMTLFYLLGLLAYANARTTTPSPPQGERAGERGLLLHVVTPLCFLLALAVKETAVTFPLALLAWELASGGTLREALRRQWPSWLLLALAALYFLGQPGYAAHLERSAELNSAAGNLASTANATAWLLRQWLLPLWPNIDPDLPLPHTVDTASLLPLLLLGLLPIVMLAARRRRPWLAFAIAWLLLQLVPLHLVLPRLDVANERQMYLAGWPLALLVAAELRLRLAARPRLWRAAVAALLLACFALTVARNRDYASEIALWEATARVSPDKARVHNNLGYAYAQAGRNEDAQREYRRALQLDPRDFRARNNLRRLESSPPSPPQPSHL